MDRDRENVSPPLDVAALRERLAQSSRRTIAGSNNAAVVNGMKARNNGRYNGNGRHWRTPPELFTALHQEFRFTLDPCAAFGHPPLAPELATITERDQTTDGLSFSWRGSRVFMNPPYGREIYAWTRKARTSGADVVVGLLPASTDLAWWHEDVIGHAEVRYLRGRVRFLTDGPYRASGFFPSVVVIWRNKIDVAAVNALPALLAAYEAQQEEIQQLREALEIVLASAHPHPVEHKAMTKAWAHAREVLKPKELQP